MKGLTVLLISVAILALLGGMTAAPGAPQEAVVCALACFIAILARIAQASAHHSDIQEKGAAFFDENGSKSVTADKAMKGALSILTVLLISVAILALLGGMSAALGAPQEAVVCALACFIAILARIAQAAAHHADIQEKGPAASGKSTVAERLAESLATHHADNQEKGATFDPEEEANSLSIPDGENEGKGAWLVLIIIVIIIGCLIYFDYL